MNKKTKDLILNVIVFAIGNVFVKMISLFLMPLYTSYMTTEQYGTAELLNNLIEIALPILTLCIIDAVYRYSIDENTDKVALFTNSLKTLLFGDVVILVGCIVLSLLFSYRYIYYFALLYISTTIHKLCSQFSRGLGHSIRFAVSGILNALLLVVFNYIFLILLDYGIDGYLLSLTFSHLIAGIFCFIASKEFRYIEFKKYDKLLQKELLRFSIPNIPNTLSWWLNNISSRYIVLFFLGSSAAGLYTAASRLPAIVNMLGTIFQQAWQYSTSKELTKKDSNYFFSSVFRYYVAFIIVSSSIIITAIPYLSYIVLRGDFYIAWRYVPLLLSSAAIGCISMFFGTFYTAKKDNRMAMITTMVGGVVNISLNLILVKFIGITSAILSSLISFSVITIMRVINTKKFVELSCNWKKIILEFVLLILQSMMYLLNINFALYINILLSVILILLNIKMFYRIFKKAQTIITKIFSK